MRRFVIAVLLHLRDFFAPLLQPHRQWRFWLGVLGGLIIISITHDFQPMDFRSWLTWMTLLGIYLITFTPEEIAWRKKSKSKK